MFFFPLIPCRQGGSACSAWDPITLPSFLLSIEISLSNLFSKFIIMLVSFLGVLGHCGVVFKREN